MHELDRAHVEATCRLPGDEQLRIAAELSGDDDLLLVAAGEIGSCHELAWRADVEVLDALLGDRFHRLAVQKPPM